MSWRLKGRSRPQAKRLKGDFASRLNYSALMGFLDEREVCLREMHRLAREFPTRMDWPFVLAGVDHLFGDRSQETYRRLRLKGNGEGQWVDLGKISAPLWAGQWLGPEQMLLVWFDSPWGLGDCLEVSRYLPFVKRQSGAHTIFCVKRGFSRVFRSLAGVDELTELPLPTEGIDAHLPIELLPCVVPTTAEVLGSPPYLQAESEKITTWGPMFKDPGTIHAGIHWQADLTHRNAMERTPDLSSLARLFRLSGVRWYSLQRDGGAALAAYPGVADLGNIDGADRFVETAAVIANLDLVVCIDSSIAHLTGALGRTGLLLLSVMHDHRWGLGDGPAPQYPSLQRYRPTPCDPEGTRTWAQVERVWWEDCIEEVAAQVHWWAGQGRRRRRDRTEQRSYG